MNKQSVSSKPVVTRKITIAGWPQEVVWHEGTPYVYMRRFCDALGLECGQQVKNLRRSPWAKTAKLLAPTRRGQVQPIVFLAVSCLQRWLNNIDATAVSPPCIDTLRQFRRIAVSTIKESFPDDGQTPAAPVQPAPVPPAAVQPEPAQPEPAQPAPAQPGRLSGDELRRALDRLINEVRSSQADTARSAEQVWSTISRRLESVDSAITGLSERLAALEAVAVESGGPADTRPSSPPAPAVDDDSAATSTASTLIGMVGRLAADIGERHFGGWDFPGSRSGVMPGYRDVVRAIWHDLYVEMARAHRIDVWQLIASEGPSVADLAGHFDDWVAERPSRLRRVRAVRWLAEYDRTHRTNLVDLMYRVFDRRRDHLLETAAGLLPAAK